MMRTLHSFFFAVLVLCALNIAYADPPGGHGAKHHGDHHRKVKAERRGGGPPPWAPAHGYRAQMDDRYYHEEPEIYERRTREFGISLGTCDRQTLGAVLGGVVGGVVGSRIGDDDHRTVATIAGVAVGALIGQEIGRRMDRADTACTGQVLERAGDHETIRWHNPQTGIEYLVTPERTFQQQDRFCRTYTTVAVLDSGRRSTEETACRNQDGSWGPR